MPNGKDALARARDFAASVIDDGLAAYGLAGAKGISVDCGTNGTVILTRTRTTAKGETSERESLVTTGDPDRPLDPASLRDIRTQVRRHARRILRRDAIAATGAAGDDPKWSYTMHRLARGWFLHKGLDPAMATGGDADGRGDFLLRYMAQQVDLGIGENHLEDGRIDFADILDGGLQLIGRGRPALLVSRDVPETVAAAMAGRLVSDVIDHPAVRRAGAVRIEDAQAQPGLLTIVLADVQDFIRRPPKGFDRSWNRIRFTPEPLN